MPKILITGANGALAKKVINILSEGNSFEILVSSRNPNKIIEKFDDIKYLSNNDLLKTDILKDVDFILHTAFPRNFDLKDMFEATSFFEALLRKAHCFPDIRFS